MTLIRSSAPGKAILCGEYAVLSGAPALSMALNRRANVTLSTLDAEHHSVSAPGYFDGPFRFRLAAAGDFDWLDPLPTPSAFALLESVWRRSAVGSDGGLSVVLDTRAFVDERGSKLGIGSSAALAVALTAALSALPAVSEEREGVHAERALAAHLEFQGGKGSGVDIATSVAGGLIAFRRNARPERLDFPSGLVYRFFWSGQSVNTQSKIDALASSSATAADGELEDAAEAMPAIARQGNAGAFLVGLRRFVQALSHYDGAHGLGIFAAGHRALTDFGQSCRGLVYKPCGAGGGDIGIAVTESPEALNRFAAHAQDMGFLPLDAHLEARGVLVEA